MTEDSARASIVRFAAEVDDRLRADFLARLQSAELPTAAGWDLGDRGPEDGGAKVLALVNLIADVSEISATAVSGLGTAVSRWLRSISQPGDPAFVELTDRSGQHIWRLGAADTPLAYGQLRKSGTKTPSDAPLEWNGLAWSVHPRPAANPAVFVSYAHESEQHKADVLALCEVLAANAVEPRLDRWSVGDRRDWQLWATRQMLESDYVLVIASQRCKAVGDGTNDPDTNLGLQSEMRTLRELYQADNQEWTKRILPVVLPGHSIDEIPIFLQPRTADHFVVSEITSAGVDDLLRVLRLIPPRHASPDQSTH